MKLPGVLLRGAAVIVVIGAVAIGYSLLESPGQERARRVDARRLADLQRIAAATDLYWTRHARLPESLGELALEPGVRIDTLDPTTSERYAYVSLDSVAYEVCATFERESDEGWGPPSRNLWAHGDGRQCFRLDANAITPSPPYLRR